MYGGIPASLIFEISAREGVMYQLDLDLECPIWVFVNPKYLTSESKGYSYYSETGKSYGSMGITDHPYFADTRDFLGNKGYIHIERSWSNGDRVLKPFYFNNVLLEKGDKFMCAAAMYYSHHKNYNDGKPDFDLKNYNQ